MVRGKSFFSRDDRDTIVSTISNHDYMSTNQSYGLTCEALRGVMSEVSAENHGNMVRCLKLGDVFRYLGGLRLHDGSSAERRFVEAFLKEVGKKDPDYWSVTKVLKPYAQTSQSQ